jgi:TonB family protein
MTYYIGRLDQQPELQGTVRIAFVISPSGTVDSVRIVSSTMPDEGLKRRLVTAFRSMSFEAVPEETGNVQYEYEIPFVPVENRE